MPSEFVYYAATNRSNIDRLAHLADGGAYPAVRPEAVIETELPGYNDAVITRFSDVVSPAAGRIEANKRETGTLANLRDLLLPKLLSGEIRVRDAEHQLEAML